MPHLLLCVESGAVGGIMREPHTLPQRSLCRLHVPHVQRPAARPLVYCRRCDGRHSGVRLQRIRRQRFGAKHGAYQL